MSSLLKSIEKPFKDETKKVESELQHEKEKIGYELDKFGQYALFLGISGILIGIPLVNEISKMIPEAIDEAAKIAYIAKPI